MFLWQALYQLRHLFSFGISLLCIFCLFLFYPTLGISVFIMLEMMDHPIITPLLHPLTCSCRVSVSTLPWIVTGGNSFRFWYYFALMSVKSFSNWIYIQVLLFHSLFIDQLITLILLMLFEGSINSSKLRPLKVVFKEDGFLFLVPINCCFCVSILQRGILCFSYSVIFLYEYYFVCSWRLHLILIFTLY